MYNFNYDTVTPSSESNTNRDMEVVGHTMAGITPSLCSYNSIFTIDFPINEGDEV